MKFCKKCHRRIVDKLENANFRICECTARVYTVSLEVIKERLNCGDKKTVANFKRMVGLNHFGMSTTEKK